MPLLRNKDKDQNPLKAPMAGAGTNEIAKDSPGGKLRDLPNGNYEHGHPGKPPEGYKPPRESRR